MSFGFARSWQWSNSPPRNGSELGSGEAVELQAVICSVFFFFLRFSYLEDFSNHQIDVSFLVRLDKVIFCVQTGSQLLIEAGDTRLSSKEKDRMLALDLTESWQFSNVFWWNCWWLEIRDDASQEALADEIDAVLEPLLSRAAPWQIGNENMGETIQPRKKRWTLCILCICIQHVLPFASSFGIFHVKFIWSLDWNSNVCFQVIKRGHGPMFLKLGPDEIEYDSKFQLYLQSKLPNPHFRPEVRSFENSHKLIQARHIFTSWSHTTTRGMPQESRYEFIWTYMNTYILLLKSIKLECLNSFSLLKTSSLELWSWNRLVQESCRARWWNVFVCFCFRICR